MRLTKEQAAIIGAYTGVTCGPFRDVQDYASRLLGRPLWAREMGSQACADEIRAAAKADFLAICYED
jgi:hypothetical protein